MALLGLLLVGLIGAAKINVCYFTNWAQWRKAPFNYLPEDIDVNLCTHIHYAFGFVTDDGTGLEMIDPDTDPDLYQRVVALKQLNPSLTILLSVGGWSHGTGGFALAAANPTVFARNALRFIQQYNFDGIDLDWEYPGYVDHPDKLGYLNFFTR